MVLLNSSKSIMIKGMKRNILQEFLIAFLNIIQIKKLHEVFKNAA